MAKKVYSIRVEEKIVDRLLKEHDCNSFTNLFDILIGRSARLRELSDNELPDLCEALDENERMKEVLSEIKCLLDEEH